MKLGLGLRVYHQRFGAVLSSGSSTLFEIPSTRITKGALMIAYTILGVPDYNYSILGPKPYSLYRCLIEPLKDPLLYRALKRNPT